MGAWGPGLYSDDTACEVRDEFKARLEEGLTHAEAEQSLLDRFADLLHDHQVACLVYFALADTEWRHGCLSPHVKQRAEALLAEGGDVAAWKTDSPASARARSRALALLRVRLATPQPPLKFIAARPRRTPRKQLDAAIGTVYTITLPDESRAALFFVGLRSVGTVEEAVFRVLPWQGQSLPDATELAPLTLDPVPVSGFREFSLLFDGRKRVTAYLQATGVVVPVSQAINEARSMCLGVAALPQHVLEALQEKAAASHLEP